ncbi:CHASE domain-containing protein [Actimicrobium antarcticum]|uniref:PAS domain S-box protein n=1 Tax=Actimicrobium antarcticum TaxID=1051899 RepID=A0ABP7U101_9BURK
MQPIPHFSTTSGTQYLKTLMVGAMHYAGWLVLLLSLGATALLVSVMRSSEHRIAVINTEQQARQVSASLQLQFAGSIQLLRSTAAMLMLNRIVQRHTWTAYQQQLLGLGLPNGLQQLGYAQRISGKEKQALVNAMRSDGRADYRIHPLHTGDALTPVVYVAPESGLELSAPGFDLLSDPAISSLLDRATDTGLMVLGSTPDRYRLRQPSGSRDVLMILPVFPGNAIPTTLGQRRKNLVGFVFAVLQINDALLGLTDLPKPRIALRVFDSAQRTPQSLLYQSAIRDMSNAIELMSVALVDQIWTIEAEAPRGPFAGGKTTLVAAGGLLFSALLFWLCQLVLRHRALAGKQAHLTAQQIGQSQLQLAAITALSKQAIITFDRKQRVMVFNPGAEQLFQTSSASIIGVHLSRLLPHRLKGAQPISVTTLNATKLAAYRLRNENSQLARRANGELFPFEATIFRTGSWTAPLHTILLDELPGTALPTTSMSAEAIPLTQESIDQTQRQLQHRIATLDSLREGQQKYLAQEMHDDFGQLLAAMKIDLDALHLRLQKTDGSLIRQLDGLHELVDAMVISVRRIVANLPPKLVEEYGLFRALELLLDGHAKRHRIHCDLQVPAPLPHIPPGLATPIYRLVQEALSNVTKHAAASTVRIQIDYAANELLLTMADNGKGISNQDREKSGSFGLIGMQERVFALDGSMQIASTMGGGVVITISIPVNKIDA